ncbi:MAG: hypothetical protein HN950_05460, partial [Chloroflexi bacterium]|nr:hypothetical protein [Chloroflexota bacterium]
MLKHIAIIFNKEWEDLQRTFLSLANFQVGAYPILVITAGFAIYEPIKMEANWIDSPIMAFPFIFLIPFVVIGFITP